MDKDYRQLSIEVRSTIAMGLTQGLSMRAIARMLKRPHSSIIREVRHNKGSAAYSPGESQEQTKNRKYR